MYKIARIIMMTLILCIIITIDTVTAGITDVPLKDKYSYSSSSTGEYEYNSSMKYIYYASILDRYEKNRYKPASGSEITIDVRDIKVQDKNMLATISNIEGSGKPGFVWDENVPWAEWDFDIVSEGLYQVDFEYYMLTGSKNPASRALYLDGKIPFLEANNIVFNCLWKDEGEPVINSIGDETRPGQVQVLRWNSLTLCDSTGLYSEPFRFYFKPGRHTIRLEFIDQQVVIGKVHIKPAEVLPDYMSVKEQYKINGYKEAARTVEFQAESTAVEKSDPTIRRESNGDPACKPVSYTSRKLNVIGDWRWRKGNQTITWKFSVPGDGLYKIGLRVLQYWNDGLPSFRSIAVDGKIPFKEMEGYRFAYDTKWRTEVLRDSSGEPYLFYLEKGEHTLTMTIKIGKLSEVINSLNDDTILLSNMIRNIIKITGNNPDPNYDYEFFNTIPDLKGNMRKLIDSLQNNYDMIKNMSDKLPAMANNFMTLKSQLESMIKNPFSIAGRLNDLNNAMTSLGAWYMELQNQPLLIDYFLVGAPGDKWKNDRSNLFQRIRSTIVNFLVSFKKDYDNIGSLVKDSTKVKTVINVWVARGTEWAELIKEMADEDFTPKTGIMVNMNVIPAGQLNAGGVNALMLSITSGKAPDVALGVDSGSPVEFAIRDAVHDLSGFKDFNEVSKRFISNIFIPYRYRGGVYALPETMNFTVMFYRKDIMKELGIRLPDTREDLYNNVLPLLYQNGLQFYYPADFSQFLFQHEADYYTYDGRRSGLDTPEAYRAFKECSELYTNYGIPVSASFFNRMRTGEMPIGIGDYSLYITLSVAAPELAGRWGIAPLPGIKKSDGTIDRSNGGLAGQCDIIMKGSKHSGEAWKFLNWWTSTPVQTRFAREIEALVGVEARWNTANFEAFTSLSWNRNDLKVIKEQWKWSREVPVVLGGYFTGRHLGNAWNRVVINGQPVRDALEEAVEDINRELRMKQEEYNVSDRQR